MYLKDIIINETALNTFPNYTRYFPHSLGFKQSIFSNVIEQKTIFDSYRGFSMVITYLTSIPIRKYSLT